MSGRVLHIFRNTPLGRETLLESLYFCQQLALKPHIYIPKTTKFLMYFERDAIQVDLDASYLTAPKTAKAHAQEVVERMEMEAEFITPQQYTASTLPDLSSSYEFMCCPRGISDLSSKIGLGYIGNRVRRILHNSKFPVLIPSAVYKPWKSVTVLFGGSPTAINSLRLGLMVGRRSNCPVDLFTYAPGRSQDEYREILEQQGFLQTVENNVRTWQFCTSGRLEDNLWDIPHNALLVLGAYGHGVIKNLFFGSTMEAVQSTMPNNMLITGPHFRMPV